MSLALVGLGCRQLETGKGEITTFSKLEFGLNSYELWSVCEEGSEVKKNVTLNPKRQVDFVGAFLSQIRGPNFLKLANRPFIHSVEEKKEQKKRVGTVARFIVARSERTEPSTEQASRMKSKYRYEWSSKPNAPEPEPERNFSMSSQKNKFSTLNSRQRNA